MRKPLTLASKFCLTPVGGMMAKPPIFSQKRRTAHKARSQPIASTPVHWGANSEYQTKRKQSCDVRTHSNTDIDRNSSDWQLFTRHLSEACAAKIISRGRMHFFLSRSNYLFPIHTNWSITRNFSIFIPRFALTARAPPKRFCSTNRARGA